MDTKNDNTQKLRPDLPYLTADLPGLGGVIKTIPADFQVEELPKYEFSGKGTHVYAFVQKKNMTTDDMMRRIAQSLGRRKFDIGYAGRKDARAITRQWISVEHIETDTLRNLNLNNIKILEVTRHGNKLKIGHLSGNRFIIRLRELNCSVKKAKSRAERILGVLCEKGVPNYFGSQRFGYRYDSHLLGKAIVKDDLKEFFGLLLGRPEYDTQDEFIRARVLYEQGDLEGAYDAWHPAFEDHRKALRILIQSGGNRGKALRRFDERLLALFVAAWQSDLFNSVLAARMPDIDKILVGDMAWKHDNGACFQVENSEVEQPRCDAFDISPTGPLVGLRMTDLTGPAGEIENPLINALDLTEDDYKRLKKYGANGGRRALRYRPENPLVRDGQDERGEYLELKFDLPSGCYATVLLREITKQDE